MTTDAVNIVFGIFFGVFLVVYFTLSLITLMRQLTKTQIFTKSSVAVPISASPILSVVLLCCWDLTYPRFLSVTRCCHPALFVQRRLLSDLHSQSDSKFEYKQSEQELVSHYNPSQQQQDSNYFSTKLSVLTVEDRDRARGFSVHL
jgi:hypothetical protein